MGRGRKGKTKRTMRGLQDEGKDCPEEGRMKPGLLFPKRHSLAHTHTEFS